MEFSITEAIAEWNGKIYLSPNENIFTVAQ